MRTVVLLFADRERFADQRAFLQSFGDLKDSSEVAQLHATLKVKRKKRLFLNDALSHYHQTTVDSLPTTHETVCGKMRSTLATMSDANEMSSSSSRRGGGTFERLV